MNHKWVASPLGHGNVMCEVCFITDLEASVLRCLNECPGNGDNNAAAKPNTTAGNAPTRSGGRREDVSDSHDAPSGDRDLRDLD